ncbi:MAG: hypothetical protein KGL70_10280 [Betaproteobacteria bacterium]|nr:hypothetical protein [Betaproteobacteria bacterium]MDE2002011.1 hypothetical protein [Betaproteobacteria bacterium]MDE2209392.1 hypothetical protein [Betaproteobacteria bacterium]MDE2359759.1 hypothetical protein [Betaproteobacteria bacterium]
MKYVLALSIPAARLGGCAIVLLAYGGHHDDHYQDRGYRRAAAITSSALT